jgi:hypothetical protein
METEAPRRGPGRPPSIRPEMREEDPRAKAAARAAAIREHLGGNLDEGPDKFYIDQADIPDGWSVEWKRHTVFNAEDPAYQVALARKGWEPADPSMFPGYMPEGYKGRTIDRDGMRLMMRPAEITDEVRDNERRAARTQMRQKEEQLQSAPQGQFERRNKDDSLVKVRKSYEAMPIPKE